MIALPSLLRKAPLRLLFLILTLMVSSVPASAHELRPAIADATLASGSYTVKIALNLEALIAGIGPEHEDTEDAPNAQTYDSLRASPPDALRAGFAPFQSVLLSKIEMTADGVRVTPKVASLEIPLVGDTDLARESVLTLTAPMPADAKEVTFAWAADFGALILRVPGPTPDDLYSTYLQDGAASEPISVGTRAKRSALATIREYMTIGFTHILPKGLDHILFVIGLFLLSPALRPLLWQISSFTVAHTITLALGVAGVISLSPAIVEPLIAASIVYVCLENIYSERLAPWRPVLVFGFGLLHGLGFAGVLGEVGMPQSQFVTAVISFNVGVELGQLTVIAGCFLAVGLWFRNKPWYRTAITIPASAAIALIGAYWMVERIFFT